MRGRRLVRAPKSQGGFTFIPAVEGQAPVSAKQPLPTPLAFLDPDPEDIWVRNMRLRDLLASRGQHVVLELRRFVREDLDLAELVNDCKAGGRAPIHPTIIVGLVLYGMMHGVDSLRGLEHLAAVDVGAWWICGGVEPDHTTIAKRLNGHTAFLTEQFFVEATRSLLRKLKAKPGTVAIDGTVIEAAASRFGMLKREAARVAAEEARAAASAEPKNASLQASAQCAQKVVDAIERRVERAEENNRDAGTVCAAPSDPDAVNQPLKNVRASRPSYKPSIVADENKLIVGQHVHGSSETAALGPMLAQHNAIHGVMPERALADTGYCSAPALKAMVEAGIDALVPPHASKAPKSEAATGPEADDESSESVRPVEGSASTSTKASSGKAQKRVRMFSKKDFRFDDADDAFTCPAGSKLVRLASGREKQGFAFVRYGSKDCRNCPLRWRCTTSEAGRRIKRYDGDELKEHLEAIFKNPLARERYSARRVMVEPVFADLREKQRFRRFRRRGLAKVSMEFSLQCVVYNFRRAFSLVNAACPLAA